MSQLSSEPSSTTAPTKPASDNFVLSVAPMLDWTDRHCRYFHRQLSQHTVLYTEMVTTGALIYGKGDFLAFHPHEQPLVLQLGGSDAEALAKSAVLAQQRGYQEVNINVGCPSDRVQNGSFGACLMAEPELVAAGVKAIRAATGLRVSVKTRLGIDDHDSDEFLDTFIDTVADAGCEHFTLHARKAWLKGLSPKQNREIPPLQYERVYRAKQRRPELHITLNGGVKTMAEVAQHQPFVDGVMIGREAYQNPWLLTEFDNFMQQPNRSIERAQVIETMVAYTTAHVAAGGRCWHVARHMLGLFQGLPGAKRWRQYLSQNGPQASSPEALLWGAFEAVQEAMLKADEKIAEFAKNSG
ncbi:tRNA dihydrouridine(20/20a) synthase DusA [Pseudidiomarina planktonica]|nr:tRNA dihydrouridine(20/20a) synthase DusA [Pseudidiomarina planktonica]RUO62866.1 tRNA dihydrouridine(20/20a) synthase DusA [Pseudidiomarina planktonica]